MSPLIFAHILNRRLYPTHPMVDSQWRSQCGLCGRAMETCAAFRSLPVETPTILDPDWQIGSYQPKSSICTFISPIAFRVREQQSLIPLQIPGHTSFPPHSPSVNDQWQHWKKRKKKGIQFVLERKLTIRGISIKNSTQGCLGGSAVERLPSARDMILETWDRVPRRAPCMEPASPPACVSASVCVSHE